MWRSIWMNFWLLKMSQSKKLSRLPQPLLCTKFKHPFQASHTNSFSIKVGLIIFSKMAEESFDLISPQWYSQHSKWGTPTRISFEKLVKSGENSVENVNFWALLRLKWFAKYSKSLIGHCSIFWPNKGQQVYWSKNPLGRQNQIEAIHSWRKSLFF